MSYYIEAIEGMPGLLLDMKEPMANFTKDMYVKGFQKYYEDHRGVLESLENGYNSVIDKDQYIENMAQALVEGAIQVMEAIQKKSDRQAKQLDLNFALAAYVFPAVLKGGGNSSQPLADAIARDWKKAFPKTNVKVSDYDGIMKGFRRKSCFITTAVCETFGKPDDCYELTLFRKYRDTYLAGLENGEELVQTYYSLAPTIVKHINQEENREEIYQAIYEEYLAPCVSMIENGENEACKETYIRMVKKLNGIYGCGTGRWRKA